MIGVISPKTILYMKRFIIALAVVLMASATAQAQLKFGVRAGYGLNNATWHIKGASAKLNLGINHGFYVGPEARMNLGDMFGVSAGLQFEQMGTKYKADAAKTSENTYNIILNDLKGLKEELGPDGYSYFRDSVINPIKTQYQGTSTEATLVLYNISLPLSVRAHFGKLGLLGGIDLRYTVSNKLTCTLKQQGQPDITETAFETEIAMADYYIKGGQKPADGTKMKLNDFYSEHLKQSFTVGAHIGADYELYEGVALQVVYNFGLTSFIRKPWNNVIAARANSLQVGLSYMF